MILENFKRNLLQLLFTSTWEIKVTVLERSLVQTWQMTCISLTLLEASVLSSERGFAYHSFSLEFLGIQHI